MASAESAQVRDGDFSLMWIASEKLLAFTERAIVVTVSPSAHSPSLFLRSSVVEANGPAGEC
jgi:hypothetical protein